MIAAERVTDVVADRLQTGPGSWEQRVLDETPGLRRVMSCTFRGASGTDAIRLVAKTYADDAGARTAGVMATVHGQLAALQGRVLLAVPRPLFYDSDSRLLVQEVASGLPYPQLAAGSGFRAHLRAAGTALATLHGLDVELGPARTLADNLRELMHPHPVEMAERVPAVSGRVATVVEALEQRAAPAPVAPAHRDLHLRQLLRDGERVWMLDWDLAAATDPALDLGNLVAYMSTKLAPSRAEACTEALLDGYASGDRHGSIERRAASEAFTYLRLACKRFRLQGADWRGDVDDMLTRAERALER